MVLLGRIRNWLNNLARSAGGKRLPQYATRTANGEEILVDASEPVIGNSEATDFFRDVCGGSLKEIMLRAGFTNVPATAGEVLAAPVLPRVARAQQMALFKRLGVRVTAPHEPPIYAKPGTYPHVELGRVTVAEEEWAGEHRPLVIKSSEADQSRPTHATVVFTVLDAKRQSRHKQVTVHFHGRGVIRAKGFTRELGGSTRPIHYDGEEVRALIERRARHWSPKVYWCSAVERY
jgi:hypothetical protein